MRVSASRCSDRSQSPTHTHSPLARPHTHTHPPTFCDCIISYTLCSMSNSCCIDNTLLVACPYNSRTLFSLSLLNMALRLYSTCADIALSRTLSTHFSLLDDRSQSPRYQGFHSIQVSWANTDQGEFGVRQISDRLSMNNEEQEVASSRWPGRFAMMIIPMCTFILISSARN